MIDNTRVNRKGQKDTMKSVQSRKSKNDRQYKGQQKGTKRQTMSYTENLKFSNINPTKNENELRCSGKVNNSYSTSETCHVTIVENSMINHQ